MEIRSVETWVLRLPQNREHRESRDEVIELIGATVTGEGGATGMGYTWTVAKGAGSAVKALLDNLLTPRVIGRDVAEYRAIWDDLWWARDRVGGGLSMMAIAVLDIAFWDLKAKARGVPLAQEIGQVRDRVPTYSSGRYSPVSKVEEVVPICLDAVEQGFGAIKLRVGVDVEEDLRKVEAVREAVGPGVRLMCDANQRMDLTTAMWFGRKLAEQDVFWFEEPMPSVYVDAHRALQESLSIPLSMGEHLFTTWEFTQYIESGAARVLNPDVCFVGGVTEFARVAELALAHGLPIAPHMAPEISIHLGAAYNHAIYVESFPILDEALKRPLVVEDGHVLVPTEPGHGAEFHDWVWDKHRVQ